MRRILRRTFASVFVLPALLAGCDVTDPEACTAEIRYGIVVEVYNLADGRPIVDGLAGLLREGEYAEEMSVNENLVQGAPERAGTYDLTITAEGYETLRQNGISVRENECHVETRTLTAELTPIPLG
jgi:hypothetical protein